MKRTAPTDVFRVKVLRGGEVVDLSGTLNRLTDR
jgi:hypothetical protein